MVVCFVPWPDPGLLVQLCDTWQIQGHHTPASFVHKLPGAISSPLVVGHDRKVPTYTLIGTGEGCVSRSQPAEQALMMGNTEHHILPEHQGMPPNIQTYNSKNDQPSSVGCSTLVVSAHCPRQCTRSLRRAFSVKNNQQLGLRHVSAFLHQLTHPLCNEVGLVDTTSFHTGAETAWGPLLSRRDWRR